MRIFVTGGTGLVGTRLIRRLRQRKDDVVLLTRRPEVAKGQFADCQVVAGDPTQDGPWKDAVRDCDAVVNLAGENIFAQRWDDRFKFQMRESRVRSTENVVAALSAQPKTAAGQPKVLVNASAIGYYGPHGDEELDETSPPGNDFLGRLAVDWEDAARTGERAGLRVAIVRVGIVLAEEGGALKKMLLPFKLGVGGPVGSGAQWMSWIHHFDLAGIFMLALDNPQASGPLNGTAPNPVTNRDFAKALGAALKRPAFLPTPVFGLKLMLGEVADVVATGQRVLPKKVLALGFDFTFPTLDKCLLNIFGQ